MAAEPLPSRVLPNVMNVVGVDIGGANLKAATLSHVTRSCVFPLWKTPDRLGHALVDLLRKLCEQDGTLGVDPSTNVLAVTMTGELADCFCNKSEGVQFIADAAMTVVDELGWRTAYFYGVDGRFHTVMNAKANVDVIAASNWHAMARFVAAQTGVAGWLVDIGSTTCDIIGFGDGDVLTNSQTDYDRLGSGELVYVGCQRTPWCALVDEVDIADQPASVPVMNELFATTDDAALMLGHVAEDPLSNDTADGQSRTVAAAIRRIARMVGLDDRDVDLAIATKMSDQVVDAAGQLISRSARRLASRSNHADRNMDVIVLCGHGQWLLPATLRTDLGASPSIPIVDLQDKIGAPASRCGPAIAVASLLAGEDKEACQS